MANETGMLGFGEYLKNSFSGITIVNKAIGGRSARSYWNEGRFQAIADLVKAGDYVLMFVLLQTSYHTCFVLLMKFSAANLDIMMVVP